jgi:carbon-monoxide dehydrogenase iron sulfur subunit
MSGRTPSTSFPNRCRHCNPAPCEQVCPTGAISRDAGRDLVLLEWERCIACAMCAMVCPFDAVSFAEQADGLPARVAALKCDGCVGRLEAGREPACVEACKTGALVYGELNELIAAGRAREANVLLTSAFHAEAASARAPAHLGAWRGWGAATTQINEGVGHGRQ